MPDQQLAEAMSLPTRGRAAGSSQQQQQQQQQQQHRQQQDTQLPQQQQPLVLRRRGVLLLAAGGALLPAAALLSAAQLLQPPPAAASKLGAGVDALWEGLGGGPADLTFPDSWVGQFDVQSTLVDVQLPLGEDMLPPGSRASVQRARKEDLNKPMTYQVAFMRNAEGKVVYDRRFNTAALLSEYYGSNADFAGRIKWSPSDPNTLSLTLPEGLAITTRVLRRSEQQLEGGRLETSEFVQQVFDDGNFGGTPRVKASQCFTKMKFRDEAAAAAAGGGPMIVATQVVSDYLTPFEGDGRAFVSANNSPVTVMTYKLAFWRHSDVGNVASVLHVS